MKSVLTILALSVLTVICTSTAKATPAESSKSSSRLPASENVYALTAVFSKQEIPTGACESAMTVTIPGNSDVAILDSKLIGLCGEIGLQTQPREILIDSVSTDKCGSKTIVGHITKSGNFGMSPLNVTVVDHSANNCEKKPAHMSTMVLEAVEEEGQMNYYSIDQ